MTAGALRLVVLSTMLPAILGVLAGTALAQEQGGQPQGGRPGGAGAPDDAGMMEQVGDPDAGETPESEEAARAKPVPAGMHLSTYASTVCARIDRTGAIDSGAAVIQLVEPESGEPLAVKDLAFGRGPLLWVGGALELRDVDARMRVLATPTEHDGDKRARVVLRVELVNRGEEQVTVRLGARLSPGGGDPLRRPVDALDFAPGTRFAADDGVVTRDGSAILAWVGPDPQVTVADPPQSPEATACTLVWDLPVQPNTARYLDLSLAGAAHQPVADEEGWRQTLSTFSYVDLEEQLGWQTDFRGTYTLFSSAMPQVNRALDASLHFLRTLGEANREVVWLTDQPYGFPPTDAAVPAEITALFYEWGMATFAETYLRGLVANAVATGQQLSPERRVALVAGLVAAVRLVHDDEQLVRDLADVIRALVVEGAAVAPWLDPELVRADMAAILLRADPVGGAEAAERLPQLQWSEDDEGPVAARMLAARKALSAGDREGFWEHYSALLDGTSRNGLGSMTPGGDLDGRFPIGFMNLSRAMLIDDHGRDLRLMEGAHVALLPERDELDLPWLPTVFGLIDLETYRVPGRRLVTTVRLRQQVEPNLIFVHVPCPYEVQKVVDSVGGKARLMPDGSVAAAIEPFLPNGLNFTVTAREAPPAER